MPPDETAPEPTPLQKSIREAAVPANPVEALARALATDPVLTGAFPGGWHNGAAPTDTESTTYGVVLKADTTRKNTWKPGYSIDRILFHVVSVADSATEAERLASLVKARLLPTETYTPPRLVSADGNEPDSRGRVLSTADGGEKTVLDPTRGPIGSDVWWSIVPVLVTVARGG